MTERRVYDDGDEHVVETSDGGAGAAIGASSLIQTIVWAIVVLVLLAVGLWALHVYTGLF